MENGPFEDVCPIEYGDIPASYVSLPEGTLYIYHQPMVNWSFGSVVWDSNRGTASLSNNSFHKGIPGIQTTNPNHQLTIGYYQVITIYKVGYS